MILRFLKKLDFPFLSLGRPSHCARVWCLGRVPKHRNQWQEVEGLLFSPKNSRCIFWAFIPRVWLPYSSFQQVRLPSIPIPMEEDTSKIWDTTGTVFIQGPSIILQVWRCIMFNGSYALALDRDTKPGHHGLVRPDSRRQNLIFSQTVISYTLLRRNHWT